MAIKVKVGDVTQVIPNAKEVRDKILALRLSVPVTSVGGQTGAVGKKVTIFTDGNDVSLAFANSSSSDTIFGFSVLCPNNRFAPNSSLTDYFIVRAWTGSSPDMNSRTPQTVLAERHISCVHDDSGLPKFKTNQSATGRWAIPGITLLQL